jgi:hypothetical protein
MTSLSSCPSDSETRAMFSLSVVLFVYAVYKGRLKSEFVGLIYVLGGYRRYVYIKLPFLCINSLRNM